MQRIENLSTWKTRKHFGIIIFQLKDMMLKLWSLIILCCVGRGAKGEGSV